MEYQKTLRIDVKNIEIYVKIIWRPIYEVIDAPFFEETEIFLQYFLYFRKNNPNQP